FGFTRLGQGVDELDRPGQRAFELRLASSSGVGDPNLEWFRRAGLNAVKRKPGQIQSARLNLMDRHAELSILEGLDYKRWWHVSDIKKQLAALLLDRIGSLAEGLVHEG